MIIFILGKLTDDLHASYMLLYCCLVLIYVCAFYFAGLGFLRRPLAIVAAALTAVTIAFLNDRYA